MEPPGLWGYDTGKKGQGRKRHPVVDTLELPLRAAVQAADVQDRDGTRQGACLLDMVRRNPDAEGFEVLPKRWIVERTFAWFTRRHRRPGKDCEHRLDSSEAWIHIALSRCMLKRPGMA